MDLGRGMQVRTRSGTRAAVIELRRGLYVVAEIRPGSRTARIGDTGEVYDKVLSAVSRTVSSVKDWTKKDERPKRRSRPERAKPNRTRRAEPVVVRAGPRVLPEPTPEEYDGSLRPPVPDSLAGRCGCEGPRIAGSASWRDILSRWDPSMSGLARWAVGRYGRSIREAPKRYVPAVRETVEALDGARAELDRMKRLLPKTIRTEGDARAWGNFRELSKRWHELAAGLHVDEQGVSFGVAPLLVVGGIAMGVAAIAWGIAALEYARNLREQSRVAADELQARVRLSEQGKALQASTLPHKAEHNGTPTLVLLGLGAAAAATLVAWRKS